jgi:hypothetical protein
VAVNTVSPDWPDAIVYEMPLQVTVGTVMGSTEVTVTVTTSPTVARVASLALFDLAQYSAAGGVLSMNASHSSSSVSTEADPSLPAASVKSSTVHTIAPSASPSWTVYVATKSVAKPPDPPTAVTANELPLHTTLGVVTGSSAVMLTVTTCPTMAIDESSGLLVLTQNLASGASVSILDLHSSESTTEDVPWFPASSENNTTEHVTSPC